MLEGCDHCGNVLQRGNDASVNCPECGHPLRSVDLAEAQVLKRERRIAEQFRRTTDAIRTGRA